MGIKNTRVGTKKLVPQVEAPTTAKGRKMEVHFIAVFNAEQQIIGDALYLTPPGSVSVQMVGDKMGFQFFMPKEIPEISIVLSRPEIVGIALMSKQKKFLVALSIPGRPEDRHAGDVFVLRSRYIIMAPRQPKAEN